MIDQKHEENIRTPRASSSRGAQSRVAESRSPIAYAANPVIGVGSRLNLPETVVKKLREDGQEPAFVVYASGNQDQKENYFTAVDKGWRPLRASEYPELARNYEINPFGDRVEDQLIRRGGQIAMVRDKDIHDQEQAVYREQNRAQKEYSQKHYCRPDGHITSMDQVPRRY